MQSGIAYEPVRPASRRPVNAMRQPEMKKYPALKVIVVKMELMCVCYCVRPASSRPVSAIRQPEMKK